MRYLQTAVIVLLGVVVALILYPVINAQFSMDMSTGMSPGFAWLLEMRAADNGGQIAPSFDELGIADSSGGVPFSGAIAEDTQPSLLDGIDLAAAPAQLGHNLLRLSVGIVVAIVVEIIFMTVSRAAKRRSAAA